MRDVVIACSCHTDLVVLPADGDSLCIWPACLTDEENEQLLAEIESELRG